MVTIEVKCYDGITRKVTWKESTPPRPEVPNDLFCERNCKYCGKGEKMKDPETGKLSKDAWKNSLCHWCANQEDIDRLLYPSSFEPELPDYKED